MMAKKETPSIRAAATTILPLISPAASGWRAIDSRADVPILPIPQEAPSTMMDDPRAAPILAQAAPATACNTIRSVVMFCCFYG